MLQMRLGASYYNHWFKGALEILQCCRLDASTSAAGSVSCRCSSSWTPAVGDSLPGAVLPSAPALNTQSAIASNAAKCHLQQCGTVQHRHNFSSCPPLGSNVAYEQGQSPAPKLREYFYYIDHQGMLFLDDARMKNFTSCFKDKKFLQFFFKRLRLNEGDRYPEFPYVSLCGRERNYVRCDDIPIVYSQLIPPSVPEDGYALRYNYGDDSMTTPFMPGKVIMEPASGRVYHPAPPETSRVATVALLHTKIALLLAANFKFGGEEDGPPSHLFWQGSEVPLDYEPLQQLQDMAALRRYSLGLGDTE